MKNSRTLNPSKISQGQPVRDGRSKLNRLATALVLLVALLTGLPAVAAEKAADHPGVVNINEAGIQQLQMLPRVGPALAERIFTFREENGDFDSAEDLILVRGIGERTFEMLRSFVVVKGETTLTRKLQTSDVPSTDESED